MIKGTINILLFACGIAYPLCWLWDNQDCWQYIPPVLGVLWALKGYYSQGAQRYLAGLLVLFFSFISITQHLDVMYSYPIIINGALLILFGASLWQKQTIIERLARLQTPNLSDQGIRYTRNVTRIWCGFFIFNILVTACSIYLKAFYFWALYNGVIAYGLMGILLAGEWLIRQKVKKAHDNISP